MGYIIKVNANCDVPAMNLKAIFMISVVLLGFGLVRAFAQGGGKAEPLRIKFATGRSGTTLVGTLVKWPGNGVRLFG